MTDRTVIQPVRRAPRAGESGARPAAAAAHRFQAPTVRELPRHWDPVVGGETYEPVSRASRDSG
jgi:hypothetical protein